MGRTFLAVRMLFTASGASALVFETLWFHQARLVLGSSVWASSLVPAAFMAGLGVGSGLGARHGDSLERPLRAYAVLELAVAASGLLLVHLLPVLEAGLAPLFRPFLDDTATLATLRVAVAFSLLLLPSTAMGLTLPLLTRALTGGSVSPATPGARPVSFGRVLGELYGWNTIGAVLGAVGAEAGLIPRLGIHGTAVVAASLGGVAATGALLLARSGGRTPAAVVPPRSAPWVRAEARWLVVAALSGAALLALEVVWFRLLSIYAITSSLAFALMLAVVLGGIALGGLVGAGWLARDPSAYRFTGAVLFAAGAVMIGSYASSHAVVEAGSFYVVRRPVALLELGVPLMLPTALLSGVVFTLTGSALRASVGRGRDASAAGHLTLFNTAGAALGSLVAGFVLLPSLGMERSLLGIALAYGVVACVAAVGSPRRATVALGAVFAASVVLFPSGSLRRDHLIHPIERWSRDRGADVQLREGLTETSLYVEKRFAGRTRSHRLVTNSITMASDDVRNRRYMKLFVYLPVAVHPAPTSALLISFGVGATAKALTDTRELERIDVVDLSRDILEMSRVVFPDPPDNPLHDPRVHTHVEDGRFFLQATDRRFDVITAEPPPPALAGVVDLYSEEYFRLVRERLSEGGITSYWLPTHSLAEHNSLSILRAFCDVFDDCSLWNGFGTDLILLGTRGARGPVSETRFAAQWRDPLVLGELRALGLETPVQLATLFIAGPEDLSSLTAGVLPVVDDFPARIVPPPIYPGYDERSPGLYGAWVGADRSRDRFAVSSLVARLLPGGVRADALPAFEAQGIVSRIAYALPADFTGRMQMVHALLTRTTLEAPVAWILGSDSDAQRVLGQLPPEELLRPEPQFHVAVQRLSHRDFEATLEPLKLAEADPALNEPALLVRLYVLERLGRSTDADRLIADVSSIPNGHASLDPFVAWLRETFP